MISIDYIKSIVIQNKLFDRVIGESVEAGNSQTGFGFEVRPPITGHHRDARQPGDGFGPAAGRSLLNVFIAIRARHRPTRSMVSAALANALVALWPSPSTLAAPDAASSRVSRSGFHRACSRSAATA